MQTYTVVGDSVYPGYCRRSTADGGHVARKWINNVEYEIANKWVVPYNPYLIKRFRCHINVEYCASVKTVQYLFRYQFKGQDLITIEGLNEDDEITTYATRRYISACQAYWRFIEFDIKRMVPSVQQLTVHLPGHQAVRYPQTKNGSIEALRKAKSLN